MAHPKYPYRRKSTQEPCRRVRVETTLTEKEETEYRKYAEYEGMSLTAWLHACLWSGIDVRIMGLLDEMEREEEHKRLNEPTVEE
jgi:hypothetical protein